MVNQCEWCGRDFESHAGKAQKYCSEKCKEKFYYEKNKQIPARPRPQTAHEYAIMLQKNQAEARREIGRYIRHTPEKPRSTIDETLRICKEKGISYAKWQMFRTQQLQGKLPARTVLNEK